MEYTKEQIQEMAKIEANDKKNEHIKLDYKDGIYYGFQQGFEKAFSLFAVSGRSEQLFCECERNNPYTGVKFDFTLRCFDCNKIIEQNNCH